MAINSHLKAGELVRSQMQEGRAGWVWPWERETGRESFQKEGCSSRVGDKDCSVFGLSYWGVRRLFLRSRGLWGWSEIIGGSR